MLTKFIASRLSDGNSLFPAQIELTEIGITILLPGVFNEKEKTIPYTQISSVSIDCPFIGFSAITIETTGVGEIKAHGFLNKEVEEMKDIILSHIE
jgi:hypothetical protein